MIAVKFWNFYDAKGLDGRQNKNAKMEVCRYDMAQ